MLSLADAIIQENIHQVTAYLRHGIDLNQLDEYGFTPLIEAAIADNSEIARLLIEAGADVNMADSIGGTALQWTAENNNVGLSQLLLECGADPNAYSLSGQPVLTMPLLRQQSILKKMLLNAGANLDFAQDFINAKLLGHLFELVGTANIISPKNEFVEVDFEGFFLEVTLGMITESLAQFKSHFAARQVRRYSQLTDTVIDVLQRAGQLIKYQQYRVDIKKHEPHIHTLMRKEPLVIPMGYEGHAITFVKLAHIIVKCDRREDSRLYDNVMFYRMGNPGWLSIEFIKKLIYQKQSGDFINNELPILLNLEPITELKVAAQISGNCSWANVEACIPVLFFLLFSQTEHFQNNIPYYKGLALSFFDQWREWNKERALSFCIQSFHHADSLRKRCKAEILAAILFQRCNDGTTQNSKWIETILPVLMRPECMPILKNYVQVYCYEDHSEEGKNFLRLLKSNGYAEVR